VFRAANAGATPLRGRTIHLAPDGANILVPDGANILAPGDDL
jgi:hypothetical protein